MALSCDYVEDSGVLNDATTQASYPGAAEAAFIYASYRLRFIKDVDEVATLDDAVEASYRVTLVNETASVIGTASAHQLYQNNASDAASIDDSVVDGLFKAVLEVAVLDDAVIASGVTLVDELAVLDEEILSVVVKTVVEAAVLNDEVRANPSNTVGEAATLNDAYVSTVVARVYAVETAALDDAVQRASEVFDLVVELAVLSDETSQLYSGVTLVDEQFYCDDSFTVKGSGAWVIAADVFGMSRYTGLQGSQLLKVGKHTLSIGNDGVYVLSKDAIVEASVTTGMSDAGEGRMKRASNVYVAGECADPLEVSVTTIDRKGELVEYSYPFENRTGEVRNNRARVGKGLLSRYWQYKFTNPSGGHFAIRSAHSDAVVVARNV